MKTRSIAHSSTDEHRLPACRSNDSHPARKIIKIPVPAVKGEIDKTLWTTDAIFTAATEVRSRTISVGRLRRAPALAIVSIVRSFSANPTD
jgi:hypothetical protein